MTPTRVTWLTIASRNLGKNARRSAFTIFAIGSGFAAINLFGGFTQYVFTSLREGHIYAQARGHLTIQRTHAQNSYVSANNELLSVKELAEVKGVCEKHPQVLIATPALLIKGLLSNGNESTIFLGVARVLADTYRINRLATGMIGSLKFFDGDPLQDKPNTNIALTRALADKLHLKLGSRAIVMMNTVNGQINALDGVVRQFFDSPSEELESMLLMTPLGFAQELYDTDGVDHVSVVLDRRADLLAVRSELTSALRAKKLDVEVLTWYEVDEKTQKVEKMFRVIFLFIFGIVLIIASMAVVNTVSMAVTERTREIGTLRALGVKRRGIVSLFACESTLLGLIGSTLGVVLTLLWWGLVRLLDLKWLPPQLSREIPLEIHLVPEYMLASFVAMVLLSLLAAIFPARRAARQTIVDALGHV